MREVKAYFRRTQVDAVVHALRAAGVPHMTVTHVQSLGRGVDPEASRVSMEAGMPYLEHAKLEFVCPAEEVERLVAVLRSEARTGEARDGIIFVSPIDRAVKIRPVRTASRPFIRTGAGFLMFGAPVAADVIAH